MQLQVRTAVCLLCLAEAHRCDWLTGEGAEGTAGSAAGKGILDSNAAKARTDVSGHHTLHMSQVLALVCAPPVSADLACARLDGVAMPVGPSRQALR
jgi:hypothetical protein